MSRGRHRFPTAPWWAGLIGLLICAAAHGHVGDPTVYFEGTAGPFPLSVSVRTPGVVPGLAEITLRVDMESAERSVERLTVRPVRWDAGLEGAPPADVAEPVRGEPGLYSAELWLMTPGSYSVYVEVTGNDGGESASGTAIVPVQSVATERLAMPPWLGTVLACLGLLLVAGLIRIAGAGADSTRGPGEGLDPQGTRRRRRAMAVATGIVALVLYGGKSWWDAVDAGYLDSMFETFAIEASVRLETTEIPATTDAEPIVGSQRVLRLDLTDERWFDSPPLAPDHGKLMHMFLIREPDLDVFAHLHPIPRLADLENAGFEVSLPPLPAGAYQIYADTTLESGFAQTLTATVELPPQGEGPTIPPQGLEPDPDDSYRIARPSAELEHPFDDGHRMLWQRTPGPLTVDEEVDLHFSLVDANGTPAPLEAYMGMMSHAAVRRHDGGVFVHLHPTGTISMASQTVFEQRQQGTTGSPQNAMQHSDSDPSAGEHAAMDHSAMDHSAMHHAAMGHTTIGWNQTTGTVSLPYAFPSVGTYRVWVQVKSGGSVYTAVFDAQVIDGAG